MTTRPSAILRPQALSILVLLAVGAGLLWGVPHLIDDPTLTNRTAERVRVTPPTCDLNAGSCRLTQDGWTLTFSLGPAPIASLKTLHADVAISGIDVEGVTLLLEGRDMYMGLNETRLQPGTANRRWQGTTELAVCSTGRMTWRARLLIDTHSTNYETWFDFEAR